MDICYSLGFSEHKGHEDLKTSVFMKRIINMEKPYSAKGKQCRNIKTSINAQTMTKGLLLKMSPQSVGTQKKQTKLKTL